MSEEKTNEDRRIIQKEKLKDLYMSGYFHQLDDLFIASSIQNVSTENNIDLSFLDFNEIQNPFECIPPGSLFSSTLGPDKDILYAIEKGELTLDELMDKKKEEDEIIEQILYSIIQNDEKCTSQPESIY